MTLVFRWHMNIKTILFDTTYQILSGWRKVNLVTAVLELRDKYLQLQDRVSQLEQENTQLKEQLEREKIKATNKLVNKPSSKSWRNGKKTVGRVKIKVKRNDRVANANRVRAPAAALRIKCRTAQRQLPLMHVICAAKI